MIDLIAARPSGGQRGELGGERVDFGVERIVVDAFQIRPHSAAFSAGSGSPVSARPSARAWPTRRGRCQLPPLSGIRPSAEKLWMNLADLAATTRSQASAMLAPAPAATPLTRAMTGCGSVGEACGSAGSSFPRPSRRGRPPRPGATARSLRSCPAQKPRPAPVRTTTRASPRSASASRKLGVHGAGEAVEPVGAVERDPGDMPPASVEVRWFRRSWRSALAAVASRV